LHGQVQLLVGELNRLYVEEPALHQLDAAPGGAEGFGGGFEWIAADDVENSVYAFLRRGRDRRQVVLAIFNFTPVPRFNYRIGAPEEGIWSELLNTDAEAFGGSNHGNLGALQATPVPSHGRAFSLNLTLPPLGAIYLKLRG
jgi:1,4-alpha-glucan branching enzyme